MPWTQLHPFEWPLYCLFSLQDTCTLSSFSTFSQSNDQWARLFLGITEIGDRLPSEIMDKMISLHRSEEPNFILDFSLKHLLPHPVQHTLSAYPSIDLHARACEENHLMMGHDNRTPSVSAISTLSPRQQKLPLHLACYKDPEDNSSSSLDTWQWHPTLAHQRGTQHWRLMLRPSALWHCSPKMTSSMLLVGKCLGGLLPVAAMSPPSSSCLLSICDNHSGRVLLIDMGANVCVVPVSCRDCSAPLPWLAPSTFSQSTDLSSECTTPHELKCT